MGIINDETHVFDTCKPGTTECCRYLTVGGRGWECEKNGPLQPLLDDRVARGTMRATGDNCGGK